MNVVIKNVLSLSTRQATKLQTITLIPWMRQFIHNLCFGDERQPQITLESNEAEHEHLIEIEVDTSQLTQILINLCENGLRYSLANTQKATLNIKISAVSHKSWIYIDIQDDGPGILNENREYIFEPFFTTEKTGSGLGLYIARELSQMNGAKLEYVPSQQGCQFRLTLMRK
jgi:two-component system sensor histidine kinase PilS (NtrC family)